MKNLTIKNVPDALHEGLKRRALANRRSLNGEVMSILENAILPDDGRHPDADGIALRVAALRNRMKGKGLSAEEVQTAIRQKRP